MGPQSLGPMIKWERPLQFENLKRNRLLLPLKPKTLSCCCCCCCFFSFSVLFSTNFEIEIWPGFHFDLLCFFWAGIAFPLNLADLCFSLIYGRECSTGTGPKRLYRHVNVLFIIFINFEFPCKCLFFSYFHSFLFFSFFC